MRDFRACAAGTTVKGELPLPPPRAFVAKFRLRLGIWNVGVGCWNVGAVEVGPDGAVAVVGAAGPTVPPPPPASSVFGELTLIRPGRGRVLALRRCGETWETSDIAAAPETLDRPSACSAADPFGDTVNSEENRLSTEFAIADVVVAVAPAHPLPPLPPAHPRLGVFSFGTTLLR